LQQALKNGRVGLKKVTNSLKAWDEAAGERACAPRSIGSEQLDILLL
jgi:hypothetical protein